MSKQLTHAITPTREENYPEWYQQVIKAADLSENSPVRGCMIIKPWGYAIWENMQKTLDKMFKETGHVNAYFPLFMPLSALEKEAQHVAGFAKECAVVTHHRLEADASGKLVPGGKLEEPLIVRPTSEMIIGEAFAQWVQSYRDLPILINQWANVVRWEMRTRQFLRTSEFLWQEGHTAHATEQEARQEAILMHQVYATFMREHMAIPVVLGTKSSFERFPGAVETYCLEAMMQDRKALQMGTSHFMGQNFAKALNITFQDEHENSQHAWTTSWGVSTRMIGGMIMVHSDDDGLILPPKLAPKHVVIIPVIPNEEARSQVTEYCNELKRVIENIPWNHATIEVLLDNRDIRGGEKAWQQVKKGVPIRLEVGPRDVQSNSVFMGRRDKPPKEKISIPRDQLLEQLPGMLDNIQSALYQRAMSHFRAHLKIIDNTDELRDWFTPSNKNQEEREIHGGFALCHVSDSAETEEQLKALKLTHRCIPLDGELPEADEPGLCLYTGKHVHKRAIIAKAY